MEWWTRQILGNTVEVWGTAITIFSITLLGLELIKAFISKRLKAHVRWVSTPWAISVLAAIGRTRLIFMIAVALYAGIRTLALPVRLEAFLDRAAFLALLIQILSWGSFLIHELIEHFVSGSIADNGARATSIRALGFLSKLVLFTVVGLWGLDNFGVHITTLVTGLGVGGIAVALAVQNILGDLFASLTIVLDKPFVLGDRISVEDFSGTIEYIGLKTTRLRSVTGEQIIFSNSDLLRSRIRNLKRMNERRVSFPVLVANTTPLEKTRRVPELITVVIKKESGARFERSHLASFGPLGLLYESVYWVEGSSFQNYMDIHQRIQFDVLQTLSEQGITLAQERSIPLVAPQ